MAFNIDMTSIAPEASALPTVSDRDLVGYGPITPDPRWPNNARIAVSFVLNYEEGGENTVRNGDRGSEVFLNETPGGMSRSVIDPNMETQYEYGSRSGVYRILRLFKKFNYKLTSYIVGRAAELNPTAIQAIEQDGHELCSHGYRWVDYNSIPEEIERSHTELAINAIKNASKQKTIPVGWYQGRISPQTRQIVINEYKRLGHELLYDSDAYNDDLPYFVNDGTGNLHLVIPYTLDQNDMKFCVPPGFSSPDGYTQYLIDAFDTLYEEGGKMMTIGLHCRLIGKPGRIKGLERFLEHISKKEGVWVTRREDIARHWWREFGNGQKGN